MNLYFALNMDFFKQSSVVTGKKTFFGENHTPPPPFLTVHAPGWQDETLVDERHCIYTLCLGNRSTHSIVVEAQKAKEKSKRGLAKDQEWLGEA